LNFDVRLQERHCSKLLAQFATTVMMMILLSKVQVNIVWAQSFLKKLLLLGVGRLKSAIELR
jgi:hypothetical protein